MFNDMGILCLKYNYDLYSVDNHCNNAFNVTAMNVCVHSKLSSWNAAHT